MLAWMVAIDLTLVHYYVHIEFLIYIIVFLVPEFLLLFLMFKFYDYILYLVIYFLKKFYSQSF